MQSVDPAAPSPDTGLPPGVHVAPLGARLVAWLIDVSVPTVVGVLLAALLPGLSGTPQTVLTVLGAVVPLAWAVLVWHLTATQAASPGMRAMELQVVGFYDGRPIGWPRVLLRSLILWLVCSTFIGAALLIFFLLRHPRRQGWHDLAARAVVIKERVLAPAVASGSVPQGATTGAAPVPLAPPAQSSPAQFSPAQFSPAQANPAQRPYLPPPFTPPPLTPPAGAGSPVGRPSAPSPVPATPLVPPAGMPAQPAAPPPGGLPPYNPFAPTGGPPRPTTPAPDWFEASAPPPIPLTAPAPVAPPAPASAADEDHTVVAPAVGAAPWVLTLDDDREIPVEGLVLLGRSPQPRPGQEDALIVKLLDESRTVSKSHLAVGLDGDSLYVMDLGSTNGSRVKTPDGVSSRCAADSRVRVEAGSVVSIGDHWLRVDRS